MTGDPSRLAASSRQARLGLVALLAGACAIGLVPILVRMTEVGPFATAFWRVVLATPLLAVWAWHSPPGAPDRSRPWLLVVAGVAFAFDLGFFHWSIRLTSVANSTLLTNLAPGFVAIGAAALLGQRVRVVTMVGIVVAMAGAALLMRGSFSLDHTHILGDACGLMSAVFYAVYQLAVVRLRRTTSPGAILFASGLANALILLPVILVAPHEIFWPTTASDWSVLLTLGLVVHAGGQGLIVYGFAHVPAAMGSVALLLQPVIAAAIAWPLFHEPLGAVQALGAVTVLAGIVLAQRSSKEAQAKTG